MVCCEMRGSRRGLLKILSQHFLGGIEENHGFLKSGERVFGLEIRNWDPLV
jgi:hypothetical protein